MLRRSLPLILALLLASPQQASAEVPEPPASISDCAWAYQLIVDADADWYFGWGDAEGEDDGDPVVRFWDECPSLTWPFRTMEDKLHILLVAQCESGFDPEANDRNWGHLTGGRPVGILSFMTHLDWPTRFGFPWLDMRDTSEAAFMAAILVYNTGSPPNHFHWWSCGHYYGRVATALGVYAPEQWYCPPNEYWGNVPSGSGVAAQAHCR